VIYFDSSALLKFVKPEKESQAQREWRVAQPTDAELVTSQPTDGLPLPGPEPQVAETFAAPEPEPDWTDRYAVLAYRVQVERPYAGTLGFNEPRMRAEATVMAVSAR
jgi:hypothetical protein